MNTADTTPATRGDLARAAFWTLLINVAVGFLFFRLARKH